MYIYEKRLVYMKQRPIKKNTYLLSSPMVTYIYYLGRHGGLVAKCWKIKMKTKNVLTCSLLYFIFLGQRSRLAIVARQITRLIHSIVNVCHFKIKMKRDTCSLSYIFLWWHGGLAIVAYKTSRFRNTPTIKLQRSDPINGDLPTF